MSDYVKVIAPYIRFSKVPTGDVFWMDDMCYRKTSHGRATASCLGITYLRLKKNKMVEYHDRQNKRNRNPLKKVRI